MIFDYSWWLIYDSKLLKITTSKSITRLTNLCWLWNVKTLLILTLPLIFVDNKINFIFLNYIDFWQEDGISEMLTSKKTTAVTDS